MPLQSWSKKVRQYDFTLPWAIQVGKDAGSGVDGQLTVTVSNVAINTSTISASTEDTSVMFPADPNSLSVAGQIVRGIYKFDIPSVEDADSFKQGFRITNSGTNNLTIINIFKSFSKIYPGEELDSADTTGTDLSSQDALDYNEFYNSISTVGSISNLIFAEVTNNKTNIPPSANLVSAFNSLTSSSTQSDIDAILNSEEFISYYGNQLPVYNQDGSSSYVVDSSKTTQLHFPIVLSPGETIVVALFNELTQHLTNPFKSAT